MGLDELILHPCPGIVFIPGLFYGILVPNGISYRGQDARPIYNNFSWFSLSHRLLPVEEYYQPTRIVDDHGNPLVVSV